MATTKVPSDLCGEHARIWVAWSKHTYDPRHPSDWPGCLIADNRTSHAQRAAWWAANNAEQMDLVARICRSGDSPQCGPATKQPRTTDDPSRIRPSDHPTLPAV